MQDAHRDEGWCPGPAQSSSPPRPPPRVAWTPEGGAVAPQQGEELHRTEEEIRAEREEEAAAVGTKTRACGVRPLSVEERERLQRDTALVAKFKQAKLEQEARKNWDLFYKRNSTHFFKDRHWTTREFQELGACRESENQKLVILEAGCGVGNCLFPLLEEDSNIFVYACDFSARAIDFVKSNPLYSEERCLAFQCDLTQNSLVEKVPEGEVDAVTLIFVLSAIHPDHMDAVLHNIYKVLKPGGRVLFRDYGLHDHAMLRFKPGHKLSENFYVRQDGTRAYFFSDDVVEKLFTGTGYKVLENEYVVRKTVNIKEGLNVPRIFIQGKFQKPT